MINKAERDLLDNESLSNSILFSVTMGFHIIFFNAFQ